MAGKSAARARKACLWDREVGGLVASGESHVGHLVEYLPDAPRCPWRTPSPRGPSGGRLIRPKDPRMPKAAPTKIIQARGRRPPSGCQSPKGRPVRRGTPLESLTPPRPLPSTAKARTSLAESDGERPHSWVREDAFLTTTRLPGRRGIRGGIRGPRTEHRLPFGELARRQWRASG